MNSRIMDNSGTQVEFSKGASGSLVNCLIVGRGAKTPGVSMENGRIERCTVLDSSTGVRLIKGGSIKNSIISNCTTILDVGKLASESITAAIPGPSSPPRPTSQIPAPRRRFTASVVTPARARP